MNKFIIKSLLIIVIAALFLPGCWEDDATDDGNSNPTDTAASIKSISFVSASNTTIAAKGNGNSQVPDYTDIKFQLKNSDDALLAGAGVDFFIFDTTGVALSSQSATSDANGEVSVRASAGSSIATFEVWAYSKGGGAIKEKSSLITITSNKVKSIAYISGEPALIALKGTGGTDITETSKLTFKAVDETGVPVVGTEIKFDLSTRHGGITFANTPDQNGLVTGKTSPDGLVSVNIVSGTVPTSVNVTATVLSDSTIWSISNPINISTGRPTQETFSFGPVGFHAVGAWTTDGIEKDVSARAYDRFHHPVPDGTVIHFRTEWGGIEPYCTTQNGACSVKWFSSGSKYFISKQDPPGRVTINASVMGEEGFVDIDGDGLFTSKDYLTQAWNADAYDLGELFVNNVEINREVRTYNELSAEIPYLNASVIPSNLPFNNSLKWKWPWENALNPAYDITTDEFLDDNGNGSRDAGNGICNTVLCSDEAEALGYCSKKLVRVGVQNVIIATPGSPVTSAVVRIYDARTAQQVGSFTTSEGNSSLNVIEITDSNGNPLPAKTAVSFKAIDIEGTEIKPSPLSLKKFDMQDTASIGFGSTLFNFGLSHNSDTVAVVMTIDGEGSLEFQIGVN